MERQYALKLLEWLHQLAIEDEEHAKLEETKRDAATDDSMRTLHEKRRIGFLWRADFARTVAASVRLREVPSSGNWSRFRKRAGEEKPAEQDRSLPESEAATNDKTTP